MREIKQIYKITKKISTLTLLLQKKEIHTDLIIYLRDKSNLKEL